MSPLWNDIAIILGEEIHDFLRGDQSQAQALLQAQQRADQLLTPPQSSPSSVTVE